MPAPTNAEIAYQMSGLLDRWTLFTTQLRDWLGGTPDGGPNGDGAYPLQNVVGEVFLVPCPAANSATVTQLTDPLDGLQAAVEVSVTQSQAAQSAAEQARDIALTYRDAAISASGDASMYATNSANSAAAALTSKNAAGSSATAAANSATAASTSETNAAASASDAASSKTAADTDATAAAQSAQAADASAQQAATYASGRLTYVGTWDVSGGTLPALGNKGDFYAITGTATIGGVEYANGDMAVSDGVSAFNKIDNTDKVTSVAGLIGTISTAQLQTAISLGSAAYQNTTAFATAAQGAKADTAIQQGTWPGLSGLTITSSNLWLDYGAGPQAIASIFPKSGSAAVFSSITASGNSIIGGPVYCVLSTGAAGGNIFLRPNGPSDATNQAYMGADGVLYVTGVVASGPITAPNMKGVYVQSADPGAVPDGSLWVW